jgi:alanine-glyoxylate transaminase / serine-glyoxylate transaminase / serine-pyruvate transaminase
MNNPIFIPGPTNIPDALRAAVDRASIDHRSERFAGLMQRVLAGVQRVFRTTTAETVLFPASGTGGWEAAITNTLSPGDKVLATRHGAFTDRWIALCRKHGIEVEVLEVAWGLAASGDAIGKALADDKNGQIKAVLVCHNETSTGVTSDVAAVRRAIDSNGHGALLFVDGVSSIASLDFRMDEWGIDIAIAGSQKGFMLPAGLAIMCVGPRAVAAMSRSRSTRAFFDIPDMIKSHKAGSFPYTPPASLIYGLDASIRMLESEGLQAVHSRHARLAEGVRRAVSAWGLDLCATRPSERSDTVSAILVPKGADGNALVAHAAKRYNVAFGAGLGDLMGRVFRIGHIGAMTDVCLLSGIATAEMAMRDMNYAIQLGSGVAAAQEYYRHTAPITKPGFWE